MLCWLVNTKSEIHQSNLANPYPFHPSWRRRCFAAWSPQNQISNSRIYLILTHFIHHGANALLQNHHTIKNRSIKPTSSLPILIIIASQMLRCMISTNQKAINPTSSLPISSITASQMLCYMITTQSKIHQSNLRIMASQMLCCMNSTKSEINQSNLANPHPLLQSINNPYPFHPSWRRRCFAAWSPQNQKSINPI